MAKWHGKVTLNDGSTIVIAHRNGTSRKFGYDPVKQMFYDCHAGEKETMTAGGFEAWKVGIINQGFRLECKTISVPAAR